MNADGHECVFCRTFRGVDDDGAIRWEFAGYRCWICGARGPRLEEALHRIVCWIKGAGKRVSNGLARQRT